MNTVLNDESGKWRNEYMSGCVINELNSEMSLGRTAPSEKYFRVPEVER